MVKSPVAKPAIILLHGLRGAPIGVQDIKARLEQQGYSVYTPAVPPFAGASLSNPQAKNYRPQDYADYLANWIKTQHLDHPVIIGHSMGSLVAAATAKYHPDIINRRIILLSPISSRATLPFRVISPLASWLPSRLVDYATTRFLFAGRNRQLFHHVMKLTHDCGDANRNVSTNQLRQVLKFSVAYGINDILNSEDLNNHSLNIYIIAGEKDRLVSRKSTEQLAAQLSAKTFFIQNTGHLHNYEKPTETAELIEKILQ